MEWSELGEALISAGPVGVWILAGLGIFRFLLTRSDKLAKDNVSELRNQMREWKLRAMRAELVVRAYQNAGVKVPRRELAREMEVHSDLGDLGLFGTLIDERKAEKGKKDAEDREDGD